MIDSAKHYNISGRRCEPGILWPLREGVPAGKKVSLF